MIVAVPAERMRARDAGIVLGQLPTGKKNAITDVAGVRIGHTTLSRDPDRQGRAQRTGVTAMWPHAGAPWREPVYAGTAVLNGWGEMIGITSINEWGILESPIVLTSSLSQAIRQARSSWPSPPPRPSPTTSRAR